MRVLELHLVHQNSEPQLFERAARKQIALFYETCVRGNTGEISLMDFVTRAEYWVPPKKALRLRKLILDGAYPDEIVQTLRLTKRNPISVADDLGARSLLSILESFHDTSGSLFEDNLRETQHRRPKKYSPPPFFTRGDIRKE